jgi:sec-independent protein translocase protein TatA
MFEGLFQPTHLLVIFGIALLVFGPKKLPELGKGIGEGIRGFKSAMKEKEAGQRTHRRGRPKLTDEAKTNAGFARDTSEADSAKNHFWKRLKR